MKKQEYIKPTMTVVQLQHSQQILAGSYTGVQSKNGSDDDNPGYDGNGSGDLWDAN